MTTEYDQISSLNEKVFHLDAPILDSSGNGFWNNFKGYMGYLKGLIQKRARGFPVAITDLWSRILGYRINSPRANYTMSGMIQDSRALREHNVPFPIFILLEKAFNSNGAIDKETSNVVSICRFYFYFILLN